MANVKRKRRLSPSFFIIAIPISFVISVLLLFVILFIFLRANYTAWEEKFEGSNREEIINIEKERNQTVLEAVEIFKKSDKKVDFVEIDRNDFANLVGESINSNLPTRIKIEKAYVETRTNFWKMYYYVDVKGFGTFWIYFDLNKDAVESTDLYISDLKIGNLSVRDWGGEGIVANVNAGIKDAMLLITQKDFTGRTIRNIELDIESIIIKGEK